MGLLLALAFCALAILRVIHVSVRAQRLSPLSLVAIAGSVLTAIFVFGDVVLLGDIGKQYEHGLSQPEWSVLYAVMAFQLLAIVGLLYAVLHTLRNGKGAATVSKDGTVYLLAQVVGVICGGMGLALTMLNFFYPRPLWMVQAQIVPTLVVMLIPYALIVVLWVFVKLREGGEWLDEKQRQDVGAASFATLLAGAAVMALLYLLRSGDLQGMVSVLWLPLYAFLTLLSFSTVVLFRSRESLR